MPTFSIDPHRLEDLLTYCTDFAKQMLGGHGGFHPFGAVIRPDQKLGAVGGWNGDEHPKGSDMFLLLRDGMKREHSEKKIIAAAIATDVNIPAEYQARFPDGIRVLLECPGYSRFVYLPYRTEKPGFLARIFGRGYRCEYGELFSVDIPPVIMAEEKNS